MKRFFFSTLFLVTFFCTAGVFASEVEAASLIFSPTSTASKVDDTFSVAVNMDAGTSQVAGTDIYIAFDKTAVSLQSVTGGSYFPLVNNIPADGRLYISGVVANSGEFKTGTGTVATLVFKSLAAGTSTLTFECDITKSDTSKISQNDINASNIIDCSVLTAHTVTVAGLTGTLTPSPGASGTAANTTPTTLPESGVYDTMLQYTIMGGVLVLVGLTLRAFMLML